MSNIVLNLIVGTNENINDIYNDICEQANQLLPQEVPKTINNYAKTKSLVNFIKEYYLFITNNMNTITSEINNILNSKETMNNNSESLNNINDSFRRIKNSTLCLKKQIRTYYDVVDNIDKYFDISEEDNCYTDMMEVIDMLKENITDLENQLNK